MKRRKGFIPIALGRSEAVVAAPAESGTLSGFTLYEVMVSIAVMLVLSAMAIGYGSSNRAQAILLREEAALTDYLGRARALALRGYVPGGTTCAYGVHFAAAAVVLFEDRSSSCAATNYAYDSGEELETYTPQQRTSMDTGGVADVTFVPPEILVHAYPEPASWPDTPVTITLTVGSDSTRIQVYESGQITTL